MSKLAAVRRMRMFLIIWTGQLVSLIGSGLTSFALGVWIYEQTGSATQFALNMVAYFIPRILLGPVAGVVIDRSDRRRVMMFSDALAGSATLGVLILFLTGNLEVWHVYIASALNSAAGTFQWPAYGAATTMLVPQEHLGRASGMTQAAYAISELVAPAVAGLLYVSVGMRAIFAIDLATFLFSIFTLSLVRIPHPKTKTEEHSHTGLRGFLHEASFGWRYLRERPGLLRLLMVFAVCNFLFSLSHPLIAPMVLDQEPPDTYGFLASVIGAGMIAGTVVMSAWGGPKRRIVGVALGDMAAGLFSALMGFARSLPVLVAGGFGVVFMMPISNGSSQALWQSKVAPDVQGRVFSVRIMIAFSIIPIANALAGPLADHVFTPALMPGGALADTVVGQVMGVGPGRGIGLLLAITGLLYTAVASISLIHPRIRRVELELPDALPQKAEPPRKLDMGRGDTSAAPVFEGLVEDELVKAGVANSSSTNGHGKLEPQGE